MASQTEEPAACSATRSGFRVHCYRKETGRFQKIQGSRKSTSLWGHRCWGEAHTSSSLPPQDAAQCDRRPALLNRQGHVGPLFPGAVARRPGPILAFIALDIVDYRHWTSYLTQGWWTSTTSELNVAKGYNTMLCIMKNILKQKQKSATNGTTEEHSA